ncbi:c6 zinc finger domain containing protein [Grosmannia clavigera kw1407]|uniref:C6 zinc finger domain containing protein n=1 Tax=Grosmannia clavigera (strain kw1407 / UAMH 11150) TaxID=655863 RepID=F0XJV1_GROCL|nr:c6 zinc finger domain containing protein [Grosmannia clavigera kw1407]EFX02427.1 c6 zinc finger domain containing protein [Grosmannia clavigera kw1407]
MPRRSRRDPAALCVRQRVRTGCKTCRQRKVKCDEARPCCHNCSRRGLACDSGLQLKWQPEFASRGLAFGRQGCWAKRGLSGQGDVPERQQLLGSASPVLPPIHAHHFINTLFCELADSHSSCLDCVAATGMGMLLSSRSTAAGAPPDLVPPRTYTPSSYPTLLGVDAALLDYYLVRLCPLTTPSHRHPSPFASLVVPVLHETGHGDVLRAAMALAARHCSMAADSDSPTAAAWGKTALELHADVMGALRRRLAALAAVSSSSTNAAPWDAQILVLMMFLCLYEIVDKCDHRWVIHLRASQDVVRRSRNVVASRESGSRSTTLALLAGFAERFFAFQDVISRAACENASVFGADYWEQVAMAEASETDVLAMDVWMGCSAGLVRVLCRITDLSRLRAREAVTPAYFAAEAAALEDELDRLDELDELHRLQEDDDDGRDGQDPLLQAAELKRLAVRLYLYCVLHDAAPATPAVARLVRTVLEGTARLVVAGCTAGLSFPLFVAAVELDAQDAAVFRSPGTDRYTLSGRRLVLETLVAMAHSSLANLARTQAVIEKVWRMRDLALDGDEAGPVGQANDWAIFVGPYSANISLA